MKNKFSWQIVTKVTKIYKIGIFKGIQNSKIGGWKISKNVIFEEKLTKSNFLKI